MKDNCGVSNIKYVIPTSITALRLLAVPAFYYTFLHCSCAIAFSVFLFAALTDITDGLMARKLTASTRFGAYADAITDFLFIIAVFAAFLQRHWYCIFIFIPIGLSFINFLVSSGVRKPLYDPLGKYMGLAIMIMIAITMLIPYPIVRKICTYGLAVIFVVNIISRMRYLGSGLASGSIEQE